MSRPARGEHYVGIDIGTQSVRVVVVDAVGSVCALAAEPLSSQRHDDRHEQSPESWWDAVGNASRRAVDSVKSTAIRGVSVCGTSGTFTITRGLDPVTPGVMYDDGRGRRHAAHVRDAGAEVWDRLGYPMQPTWALPRLCGVLATMTPALRRAWDSGDLALMHQGDLVSARLAGHPVATDWAQALKTGYDLEQLAWPAGVMGALGVDVLALPDVVAPGVPIGVVGTAAADHTGIAAGTPIISGTTDSCAAQISAGALEPGMWNSVLGTTLAIKGVAAQPLTVPRSGVYSHRSPDGGWLPGGASNVGAGYLRQVFGSAVGDASDAAASQHEPAPGVTYPLLGRGERFPFEDEALTGFTTVAAGTFAERYAAALQGLALVERMAYDMLRSHGAEVNGPIAVTGGATRSHYLLELRATVLGLSLRVPAVAEPAFGMAILAAAAEREPVHAAARRMVRIRTTVDPAPERTALWEDQLAILHGELARRSVTVADASDEAIA